MADDHSNALFTREIVNLGRVLLLLDPNSLLWLAIAVRRGELLRRQIPLDLRLILLAEPTSVIDL